MRVLDFFCYFWYRWYQNRKMSKSKIFTDFDNAINAFTMQFAIILMLLSILYEYFVNNKTEIGIPKYPFIILVTVFYFFLRVIYINRGRLSQMIEKDDLRFNIPEKSGRVLPVIILIFTLLTFFILAIILHSL